MSPDMIAGVIALAKGRVQDSGAAIADHVTSPIGKYTHFTHECSEVASGYNAQLVWAIATKLYNRIASLWGEKAFGAKCMQLH